MTREQFLRGFLLLTTQPWGKAYRTTFQTSTGEPSPAEIQIEFYYQAFMGYQSSIWQQVCEQYATGEQWPSIDAMKTSLRHLMPVQPLLPAPQGEKISMREALADNPEALAIVERILQHGPALSQPPRRHHASGR